MKKLLVISSFLISFSGIWMTSCEPSHKGTGAPAVTDNPSTQSGGMDSTVHADTSHQKR